MKYHIRRSEQEIIDEKELQSILEKGKYGIVGLSKNDEPYVITLSYGYDKVGNVLFFHCGKEGQKIDFIKSNPRACVTIIEDDGFEIDSCNHTYKSLILRGEIHFESDRNEIDRAIRLMILQLEKREPNRFYEKLTSGNKHYDNLQILRFAIENITGKKQEKGTGEKKESTATSPNRLDIGKL